MSTYVFAVPILPGKTNDLKKYIREMNGPRKEEYDRSSQKVGLQVEQMWLQHTPDGDMLIVRWEADNPAKVFEQGLNSQGPFDKWFRDKVIIECLGVDPSQEFPLNELISDQQLQTTGQQTGQKQYQETKKR